MVRDLQIDRSLVQPVHYPVATCTIRSIGKSRTAQKNLAQQLPELKQNLEASKAVLAQTVSYGPAVAAWSSALGGGTEQALAA